LTEEDLEQIQTLGKQFQEGLQIHHETSFARRMVPKVVKLLLSHCVVDEAKKGTHTRQPRKDFRRGLPEHAPIVSTKHQN